MEDLKTIFPGIKEKEKLALHTTFHIGGEADYFYIAEKKKDLISIIKYCLKNNVNYYILGGGSNMLFSDKGFRGIVIRFQISDFRFQNKKIYVEAGVSINKLVLTAANYGFDLSVFAGIPGSVGGAIAGNSGVKDKCIGDIVESAEIIEIDKDKSKLKIKKANRDYFNFSYRYSVLKHSSNILLSSVLVPPKSDVLKIKKEIEEAIRKRRGRHPQGFSAGSFFKNPNMEKPAWALIDAASAKNIKVGDAFVSPKHANFIMHNGLSTASDIIILAGKIEKKIKDKFGIKLEPEVMIIDEYGKRVRV